MIRRALLAACALTAQPFLSSAHARQPERSASAAALLTQASAEGKMLPELLGRGGATPLCRAIGQEACHKTRALLRPGWSSSGAERKGEFVVAAACRKLGGMGECGITEAMVAIGPDGRVWTALLEDERVTLYGEPPEAARAVLKFED